MAQYNAVMTNAGALQMQKAIAGGTLKFTRMALGDGAAPADFKAQTALVSEKQSSDIADISIVGGSATVRSDFTNIGLSTGYSMKEIGIFVDDIDNPGTDVLYAYGNAGDTADYMPANTGGDVTMLVQEIVAGVGSASSVTAVIDNTAVYVTRAQLLEHVGVGGEDQHPLATTALAGFMSSLDKYKLDNICPGWLILMKLDVSLANMDAWVANSNTELYVARHPSLKGELHFSSNDSAGVCTRAFLQRITAKSAVTITIPIVENVGNVSVKVMRVSDLSMVESIKSLTAGRGYNRTISFSLPAAGDYMIQIVVPSSSNCTQLIISDWYTSNISWKSLYQNS